MTAEWFKADTWPLEAAVVWIATGDAHLFQDAVAFAKERRENPLRKPSLGMWLTMSDGRASGAEVADGTIYRVEMREGWSRNAQQSRGGHPIQRSLSRVAAIMAGTHSTGRCGDSVRTKIPGRLWKSALLIDDKQRGLLLRPPGRGDDATWQQIDVPAAPFRTLKAKHGRRPAGLSALPRPNHQSTKTKERLKTKQATLDQQRGFRPKARASGGGRPKGSRDKH